MPLSLGRAVVLVIACALVAAGLTLAASRKPHVRSVVEPEKKVTPTLTVPDVRGQAYVFATGTLETEGFAWETGQGEGYSGSVVTAQSPAPGTVVIDTGDPLITLTVVQPKGYVPVGEPQNSSPYSGSEIILFTDQAASQQQQPEEQAEEQPEVQPDEQPVAEQPEQTATLPVEPEIQTRTPDFTGPGTKPEAADEMPLPERAERLAKWIERHPRPTSKNVRYWLYQHAWIVAGARFGWWHGAEALQRLIEIDNRVQELWGVGAKSERVAVEALRYVEARS